MEYFVYYTTVATRLLPSGQYAAMSIVHGGYGFPFLSKPVYDYLSCMKYTGIDVHLDDINNVYNMIPFLELCGDNGCCCKLM